MSDKNTDLFFLIETLDFDELEKLLNEKNINKPEKTSKQTLLYKAVYAKNKKMIDFLLEKGAEVNPDPKTALNPLRAAYPDLEMIKYLQEKGADLNADVGAPTPRLLHRAVEDKNMDIVKYLLENGVDVNSTYLSPKGVIRTALMAACQKKDYEMIDYLVEKGAKLDLNIPNFYPSERWLDPELKYYFKNKGIS